MYYTADVRTPQVHHTQRTDNVLRGKVKDLEKRLGRLQLMNQALFEILSGAGHVNANQIEAKMKEIDLRDGIEDGEISEVPLRCPTCNRVSSSKHWRCLYCGLEFERPIVG